MATGLSLLVALFVSVVAGYLMSTALDWIVYAFVVASLGFTAVSLGASTPAVGVVAALALVSSGLTAAFGEEKHQALMLPVYLVAGLTVVWDVIYFGTVLIKSL